MPERSYRLDQQNHLLQQVTRELYSRNAELAVRNKTLGVLRSLDEITMASLETDALSANITKILTEQLQFQIAALAVADAHRRRLVWKAVACSHQDQNFCDLDGSVKSIPFTSRTNACAQAIRTGKSSTSRSLVAVFSPAFSEDAVREHQQKNVIKAALIFPMRTETGPIGVLVIGLNRPHRELTRFEKETLEGVLRLITIAIQKAQIYTSLRQTTQQLANANKKLKSLDALKTEFLSIASHQLRTPLAVMKGYIAMFNEGMLGKVAAKQQVALGKVAVANDQLIALVNHLLDVSRIESGRLTVRIDTVDMTRVTTEVTEFLRPRAEEQKLHIDTAIGKNLFVQADPEKLREIVINFADNAIKYTPKGSVRVTLAAEPEGVHLSVKDSGYGLTKEDLHRLFEKFSRGSASKEVANSTGLGLYVCRRLAEAMNGRVWAESEGQGKGSTFHLVLPAAKPPSTKGRSKTRR